MAVKSVARKHHYVPQGYLASFTDTGDKGGQLYVVNVKNGRVFRTSPQNVAARRDFNRVDIEGLSPDALENAISGFEGQVVTAIRKVIQTREVQSAEEWNLIFNLMALLAARNPLRRSGFNRARERTYRMLAAALVSSRATYEKHVQMAKNAGEELAEATFEEVKRFVDSGEYDIEFHPQGNLRVEFAAMDSLLPLIGRRLWSLLVVPPGGPEFVCCDHPVTLTWKGERRGPIGFGLRNTEVFFPLGRNVGMYGVFEDPMEPIVHCGLDLVARMNSRIAESADLHVFSTMPTFYVWHDGSIQQFIHEV